MASPVAPLARLHSGSSSKPSAWNRMDRGGTSGGMQHNSVHLCANLCKCVSIKTEDVPAKHGDF